MPYWPRYGEIPPRAWAAYLRWLAEGRKAPGAYVGYVFLHFYGLERRLLVDHDTLPDTSAEAVVIVKEVRRRLGLYGNNHSFRRYATSFLNLVALQHANNRHLLTALVGLEVGYEIPTWLEIALALEAVRGEPVVPRLAFRWLMNHPETRLRTPATRCPAEFETLFLRRYTEAFGDGLRLKPNRRRRPETARISRRRRCSSRGCWRIRRVPSSRRCGTGSKGTFLRRRQSRCSAMPRSCSGFGRRRPMPGSPSASEWRRRTSFRASGSASSPIRASAAAPSRTETPSRSSG